MPRDPELLLENALKIIDLAYKSISKRQTNNTKFFPLFSGGHDSYCACYVASQHPRFKGTVYHIDTGIGSKKTRDFVNQVCNDEGWHLSVWRNKVWTYERIVRTYGFLVPSQHSITYQSLKRDCIVAMTRKPFGSHFESILINGARRKESENRAKTTWAIRRGDRTNAQKHSYMIWTSPCHDWSSEEQNNFMDVMGLRRNPVKLSPLAKSGECFCGAFAKPGELEVIRKICPDVAEKIDRLSEIAKANGKPHVYGWQGKRVNLEVVETGPLCTSCEVQARAAGIQIKESL